MVVEVCIVSIAHVSIRCGCGSAQRLEVRAGAGVAPWLRCRIDSRQPTDTCLTLSTVYTHTRLPSADYLALILMAYPTAPRRETAMRSQSPRSSVKSM